MYQSKIDTSETKEVNVVSDNSNLDKKSVVAGEEVVLNEEESYKNTNEQKTKKLLDKKIIIGIVCILAIILCIVIYSLFIAGKDTENDTNNLKTEEKLLVRENEKYEGLNYSMIKENVAKQGFFYDYSKNLEGNKVDVSYIKVQGLKDKSLEEKINTKLEEEAKKMYNDKKLQDSNILYNHIYNYTDVYIFNNVLSTMYCEETCDIDGNVVYAYKGININLKDFKEFNIKDVFINTVNLEQLFKDDSIDDMVFSVSPKNIYYLNSENKIKTINLYENRDIVAIYKRFYESRKMFEKTFNANPYIFTTKRFIESDIYGLEEDNLFIDTCNTLVDKEFNDKIKEVVNELYKEAVNKARNLSYSNPSKRYLVQIIPSVEKNNNDKFDVIIKYNTYEIDKKFFNENIEKFVIESENKVDRETNIVEYFKNTIMDADNYLNNLNTDIIKKQIDENGKEVSNQSQIDMGIS